MTVRELQIARVGLMGQGVAYDAEGNIYFVPGAVPGDVVEVSVRDERKKYRDAELVRVITPAPGRRESPCKHFPTCGGCDFMHWEYGSQLGGKDEILRHVLERAELIPARFLPMIGAEKPEGYRNRIQVRRRGDRLGFLRKRSRDLVDIESCRIADPRLNEELAKIRREPPSGEQTKIELFLREDGSVGRATNRPHAAEGFSQVNVAQNAMLQQLVVNHIRLRGARRVLELFCGNGNFLFAYAPYVADAIGVDVSEASLAEGRARSEALGFANGRKPEDVSRLAFVQGFVGRATLRKLPPGFRDSYDTLVLDPPRTGVGADLSDFVHPALNTIIYISCSPVSFSQDVQPLKKEFVLAEVQAVDMFPNTRHIEFVARFERSSK